MKSCSIFDIIVQKSCLAETRKFWVSNEQNSSRLFSGSAEFRLAYLTLSDFCPGQQSQKSPGFFLKRLSMLEENWAPMTKLWLSKLAYLPQSDFCPGQQSQESSEFPWRGFPDWRTTEQTSNGLNSTAAEFRIAYLPQPYFCPGQQSQGSFEFLWRDFPDWRRTKQSSTGPYSWLIRITSIRFLSWSAESRKLWVPLERLSRLEENWAEFHWTILWLSRVQNSLLTSTRFLPWSAEARKLWVPLERLSRLEENWAEFHWTKPPPQQSSE